jgi:hypothetical protein
MNRRGDRFSLDSLASYPYTETPRPPTKYHFPMALTLVTRRVG